MNNHKYVIEGVKLVGKFESDPNPPIFLFFFLPFFLDEIFDMNLINLSAALISTPLFLYVKRLLFITMLHELYY